jgi:hypothetical protein
MENNIIGKSLSQHRLTEKTDINRRKQGIRRGERRGRQGDWEGDWEEEN